jgi:glycosyltransferase involved in cell wall biosynthesis
VFVFPSFFEGFALVLLEAMASGLPIISTTATAAPDLISDPLQGIVIDPENQEQLEAAMVAMRSQRGRLAEMSHAARRRAEEFSWDKYGERWAQLIETLA